MWPKDGNMSSTIVIGVGEGNLYKVLGHTVQALVHKSINPANCGIKERLTPISLIILVRIQISTGSHLLPSIPSRMGLQKKVVISLQESCQRTLPSYIDMEINPVHESSLLDEHREEVRESSFDLFK